MHALEVLKAVDLFRGREPEDQDGGFNPSLAKLHGLVQPSYSKAVRS